MDCFELPEALFKWNHPFDIRESLEGPAGPVTTGDLGCFMTVDVGSCTSREAV